jgi:hypothetical protein
MRGISVMCVILLVYYAGTNLAEIIAVCILYIMYINLGRELGLCLIDKMYHKNIHTVKNSKEHNLISHVYLSSMCVHCLEHGHNRWKLMLLQLIDYGYVPKFTASTENL